MTAGGSNNAANEKGITPLPCDQPSRSSKAIKVLLILGTILVFLALTFAGIYVVRKKVLERHMSTALDARNDGAILDLLNSPLPHHLAGNGNAQADPMSAAVR